MLIFQCFDNYVFMVLLTFFFCPNDGVNARHFVPLSRQTLCPLKVLGNTLQMCSFTFSNYSETDS